LSKEPSVKPEIYRKVEGLLYNYKTFDDAIASLEEELEEILPSYGSSVAVVGGHEKAPTDTSQTERWALIRAEGPIAVKKAKMLKRKKRDKAKVERAKRALSSLEREFVRLKYEEELDRARVARALGISVRTYHNLRERIVQKVAIRCGLL